MTLDVFETPQFRNGAKYLQSATQQRCATCNVISNLVRLWLQNSDD